MVKLIIPGRSSNQYGQSEGLGSVLCHTLVTWMKLAGSVSITQSKEADQSKSHFSMKRNLNG